MSVRVRFAPGSTRGRHCGGPLLTMGPASNHPADQINAIRREVQLKQWTRAKKLALVSGSIERLRNLSKSND